MSTLTNKLSDIRRAAAPLAYGRWPQRRPVVFLHIPKTAGQSVTHQITEKLPSNWVSPLRDISLAKDGETHLPPGYRYYAGHIDWVDLDKLNKPFSFTILRDPRERIGSFYAFLLREAQQRTPEDLALPGNTGQRIMLERSVDDYFFSGDGRWKRFIRNHYDNFYCSYLATGRIRGWRHLKGKSDAEKIDAALAGAARVSRIYTIDALAPLEDDLFDVLGVPVSVASHFRNVGETDREASRWDQLCARFESDANARKLERFVARDYDLLDRLGLSPG